MRGHAERIRAQALDLWARSISLDGLRIADGRLYARSVRLYVAACRMEDAVRALRTR